MFHTDVHNINIRNKGMLTSPHRKALFERHFTLNIYKPCNSIQPMLKHLSPMIMLLWLVLSIKINMLIMNSY